MPTIVRKIKCPKQYQLKPGHCPYVQVSNPLMKNVSERAIKEYKLHKTIAKRDAYGNHHSGTHYLCSLCGTAFEKGKTHFVSKVSPLYCKTCVDIVKTTFESHADRYQFFLDYLEAESKRESTNIN